VWLCAGDTVVAWSIKPLGLNAAIEYQFADLLKVEELSLGLVMKLRFSVCKRQSNHAGERRQLRSGRVKDSS